LKAGISVNKKKNKEAANKQKQIKISSSNSKIVKQKYVSKNLPNYQVVQLLLIEHFTVRVNDLYAGIFHARPGQHWAAQALPHRTINVTLKVQHFSLSGSRSNTQNCAVAWSTVVKNWKKNM
jgi:hypothetical protein